MIPGKREVNQGRDPSMRSGCGAGGGKEVPCIGKVETRASGYHIIFSYFTCLVCSPI